MAAKGWLDGREQVAGRGRQAQAKKIPCHSETLQRRGIRCSKQKRRPRGRRSSCVL